MKIVILLLTLALTANFSFAQTGKIADYFKSLPKGLKIDNSIRSYKMITDYYNYDLKGDFLSRKRVSGIITYGLQGDSIQWNDVYISDSKVLDTDFTATKNIDFMENFRYLSNAEVVKPEFFKENLPKANPFTMNLIWDVLGFEVFAYSDWNSLVLNEEFRSKNTNSEIEIANIGTFENKDVRITWIGITEMNNEICAILKYSVMNNPLKLKWDNILMRGRSHYWGEVYISLSDKQIEYVSLTEDVLTDTKIESHPENIIGYTVRTIDFSKIH